MFKWFYTLIVVAMLSPALSWSLPVSNDEFLKAEKLLKKRYYSQFDKTFPDIKSHPLAPYLELERIRTQFHKKPVELIDDFIARYKDEQPAIQLQKEWVRYLARNKEWPLFLSYYMPTTSLSLQCNRITALSSTKRQFDAIKEGQEIWLRGISLPKTCDKVFNEWQRHGFLSQELIWQRLVNAMVKRQYRLVRYLRKKLNKEYKEKAFALRDFWQRPHTVLSDKKANLLSTDVRFILLNKALKKQPELFFQDNRRFTSQFGFDENQIKSLTETALKGLALSSPNDAFKLYEFAQQKDLLSISFQENLLQGTIKTENWPLYTHLYKIIDSELQKEPKWQYWQGRALSTLGAPNHQSHKFFNLAAQNRDYYGFLASQKVGISASMNHEPNYVPASKLQRVRLLPGIKRALAFYELDRITQARREWQTVFEQQDDIGKEALAILAGRIDWSDRAIMSLAKIKSWHDLQLRFPLAHNEYFQQAATRNKINKNWIYGIARQESAFMHDVRSPVGATGLMQLMPQTARSVSRRMRIPYSSHKLIEPAYNIKLGSYYLQHLLKRYNGNRVLATAAYNAGPGNVNRWLKRYKGDIDVWIEHIPFNETKEYVQRVLTYSTIYSYRLGFLQPLIDDSTLIAWEQLNPTDELKISKASAKDTQKALAKIEQNEKG